MELSQLLNTYFHELTDVELEIFKFVIEDPQRVISMNTKELSDLTNCSMSSVIRMSQKIGFDGFSEFKYFIREHYTPKQSITNSNDRDLLVQDITETLKLIKQTNYEPFINAVDSAERVFAFGTGWGESNAINELTRNFFSSGVFITSFPSITELNWNIDKMCKNDLIILCSYSGNNTDLSLAIKKLIAHDVNIISITPLQNSYLTQMADLSLYYSVTPLNLDEETYKEYNFYSTLNILTESFFRAYLDRHKSEL